MTRMRTLLVLVLVTKAASFTPAPHPITYSRLELWKTTVSQSQNDNVNDERAQAFSDDIIPVMMDGSSLVDETQVAKDSVFERILSNTVGARVILAMCAMVYATNFPLGSIMNASLPASAATSSRMVLASIALLPFLFQISPKLRVPSIICGCFTASGYITQSIALVDIDPARVSFLGSVTVLWLPLLEWLIDGTDMSLRKAPQTWLAAVLCLMGVGVLELYDPNSSSDALSLSVSRGDVLALVQAVGFGTGCFLSSKMVREDPSQVLSITSVLIATTAFISMLWCMVDGWMSLDGWREFALPGLLLSSFGQEDKSPVVALAVLWTGLISTSLNFVVEISALGRVPPSEAAVLLASEPIWAALLASLILQQSLQVNDYVGGALIVAACLVNALVKPKDLLPQQLDKQGE